MMNIVESHIKYCISLNPDFNNLDKNYLTNRVLALVGDSASTILGSNNYLEIGRAHV